MLGVCSGNMNKLDQQGMAKILQLKWTQTLNIPKPILYIIVKECISIYWRHSVWGEKLYIYIKPTQIYTHTIFCRCCYSSGIPLLNIILSNEVECFTGTWFMCLKITWDLQTDKCYCFSGDRLSSFLQPSSLKRRLTPFPPTDGLQHISVPKDLKEYYCFGLFKSHTWESFSLWLCPRVGFQHLDKLEKVMSLTFKSYCLWMALCRCPESGVGGSLCYVQILIIVDNSY